MIVVQRIRSNEGYKGFESDNERITEYCKSNASSRVSNQIAGGDINYEEIVCNCFEKCESHHLNVRLGDLIRNHDGELFLSHHRSRFQTVYRLQNVSIENRSPAYLAALFLLISKDKRVVLIYWHNEKQLCGAGNVVAMHESLFIEAWLGYGIRKNCAVATLIVSVLMLLSREGKQIAELLSDPCSLPNPSTFSERPSLTVIAFAAKIQHGKKAANMRREKVAG